MHQHSSAMATLLDTQTQLEIADALTLVPVSGGIVRLTDWDADVTVQSYYDNATHTFLAHGPTMTVGPVKTGIGLRTDKVTVTLGCKPGVDTFNGVPWPQAVVQGQLDNAQVMIEKVIAADMSHPTAGTIVLFSGLISSAQIGRLTVQLELASWLEVLLGQNFPRNVYQAQCLHTLYDAGCTLTKASFAVTGTAHSGSTPSSIVTGLANPDGYFALGTITFTSGANAGITRSVATYLSGAIVPIGPFPFAIAVGDGFTAYPGCDKLFSTCSTKFSNTAHFRGYDRIPSPENAV